MSGWQNMLRPELLGFSGYTAASPDRALLRLHANEAPTGADGLAHGINRYPLPNPAGLLNALARFYKVTPDKVLATRGSDDAIDLLVRSFCRAGQDKVLVCPPTFGIYTIAAQLQNAGVVTVPLRAEAGFELDVPAIVAAADQRVRIVFLCSPNNPTGNLIAASDISKLCHALADSALVVVDEAYIEFASQASIAGMINQHPNLVVLRTLSKAFGLAAIRLGALIAEPGLVAQLRCLMPPYPLTTATIETATGQLQSDRLAQMQMRITDIVQQRESLAQQLQAGPRVQRVWPSEGNFLLIEPLDGCDWVMDACDTAGILVRRFTDYPGLADCVRITIGRGSDCQRLVDALKARQQVRHG